MYKQTSKIMGTAMTAVSLISLCFPIYSAEIGNYETLNVTLRGFSTLEFSAWGGLVVIIPLMISGIIYSRLSDNTKLVLLFVLYALSTVSLYNANYETRQWINDNANGFVYPHRAFIYYAASLFVAVVLFYIHCVTKETYYEE